MGKLFTLVRRHWQVVTVLLALVVYLGYKMLSNTSDEITYQTATVTKDTLITSISGSGTITSVNSTNISSKVSGTVKTVYVNNGDTVIAGQKIADVTLDDYGQERQTSAWKSYLDAKEAVTTVEKNKSEADIAMWQAQQAIIDAEDAIEYKNNNSINPATNEEYTEAEKAIIDKTLEKAKLAFTEAETKYKNADSEISAARAQVTAAWRDYQKNAATIVAPEAGVVSNLNLAAGMVISSTSSSNSNATENSVSAVSAQTFGKVSDPNGSIIATISLSEIDVITVKANQKVNLVLDAYEDKSFTGKVLAVDTSGSSSSGVTSYSVTIVLDPTDVEIYSNMAVSADIITDIQADVLLIPTTAIQTVGDQTVVEVMNGDTISTVTIEIGSANDSQTVVTSGLNEGDVVVTSTIDNSTTSTSSSDTTSPFSGINSGSSSRSSGMGGGGMPPGGF